MLFGKIKFKSYITKRAQKMGAGADVVSIGELLKATKVGISAKKIVFSGIGKTEEEMEELWSKAQTTGEIINRSGTPFNSAIDKDLAMSDAENRLITGGGLFGKKLIERQE